MTAQKLEHLTDRPLAARGLWEREMRLDLVAISPTFLVLDQVTRIGQVGHDPVRPAFGDPQGCRNVAKTNLGVVRDAEQRPAVVREEIPTSHNSGAFYSEIDCM